jgi:hypothetical protein
MLLPAISKEKTLLYKNNPVLLYCKFFAQLIFSRMKRIRWPFLFIILFFSSGALKSQDEVKVLDRVYGLDQTLYNGRKYNYFLPPGTQGCQYLLSPDYITGSVTLRGKCYNDITVNYDIFNQQLLLKYEDERGALNIIEVSKAWLKNFRLGNMNFELLHLDRDPCFYQVIGEGKVRILYYWRKDLKPDVAIGSSGFIFSAAIRESFVLMDGKLIRFRTRRSLIRIFDPGHRPVIKSYLRKNKIKLKDASDQAMLEMITYIGNNK